MNSINELDPSESAMIKAYLEGIKNTLAGRRGINDRGTLIAEEEAVFNALNHPDRGDIKVIYLKDRKDRLLMLNNVRDPGNPFVVMSYLDMKNNSGGRRPLNTLHRTLKEGEYGLFLTGIHDRELLSNNAVKKYYFYSVQFLGEQNNENLNKSGADSLKTKPLTQCTTEEKFQIFKKQWDFDKRIPDISRELFQIDIMYAKYKQPVKKEILNIEPGKAKTAIHQIIRDVYPYNIRVVLRKDFPADHDKKMQEVFDILGTIIRKLEERADATDSQNYRDYLNELIKFTKDIIEKDPKLERV